MTNARRDGLYLVLLGCAVFVLIGSALENAVPVTAADFRVVYYSARCLLEHRDPYNENEMRYTYRVDGGETANDTPTLRRTETQYIYFPSAFPLTVPFAVFPFGPAHILWLAFTAAGADWSLGWSPPGKLRAVSCGRQSRGDRDRTVCHCRLVLYSRTVGASGRNLHGPKPHA
jgi:hypothetical protein